MIGRLERFRNKAGRALFAQGVSDATKVEPERIHLVSCIGADVEYALVGHFADHYLGLGIPAENFHIVINTISGNSDGLAIAQRQLSSRGIEPEEIWVEPYTSEAMWQKRRDVQRRCVPRAHWVVSADTDEFHEYPAPLPDFLGECERNGVNCIDGVFIDRVAEQGGLPSIDSERSLMSLFPVQAMVQGQIAGFGQFHRPSGSIKLMAFDAALLPSQGGHGLVDGQSDARFIFGRHLADHPQIRHPLFRFRIPLRVHHFKWHAGLTATLRQRVQTPNVSPAGKEYGQKILNYIDAHEGRIELSDIALKSAKPHLPAEYWRTRVRLLRGVHYLRRSTSRIRRRIKP